MDTSNLFSCSPGVCFLSYATKDVQSLQPGVLNVYWGGRTGPIAGWDGDYPFVFLNGLVFITPPWAFPPFDLSLYLLLKKKDGDSIWWHGGWDGCKKYSVQSHSGRAGKKCPTSRLCHHLLSFEAHVYTVPLGRKISFHNEEERKAFKCVNSVSQKSGQGLVIYREHHPGNAVSGTQMTGLDSFHSNESVNCLQEPAHC